MWNPFRRKEKGLQSAAVQSRGGYLPIVHEPFAGAWQRNIEVRQETVLSSFSVFSCISIISGDISKIPVNVMQKDSEGVLVPQFTGDLARLLKNPNSFQTRIQFFANWVTSKLSSGNTYVLKIRDSAGKVQQLRILDPLRVRPLVSDNGEVFYEVNPDNICGLTEQVIIPAREMIHDRFNCLFHPLVGLSPIFACGLAATQGTSILENSAKFFQNGGKPSGVITIPGNVDEEQAKTIKSNWDTGYSGSNAGKTALLSAGAGYTPISITAVDAQTVEQLKMTAEIVCSVYHVPAYKAGVGTMPTYDNIEALEQQYFAQCLQTLIEEIELLLHDHFSLGQSSAVEFDIRALLRMDTERRYKAHSDGVKGGWLSPNEARRAENLRPAAGGSTPYLQQQNYSLEALEKRDKSSNPFSSSKEPPIDS